MKSLPHRRQCDNDNQEESTDLINEAYMDEVPLRFMGQDVSYQQPLSID